MMRINKSTSGAKTVCFLACLAVYEMVENADVYLLLLVASD
jgi:hypothetical protein